eukprot:RCo046049
MPALLRCLCRDRALSPLSPLLGLPRGSGLLPAQRRPTSSGFFEIPIRRKVPPRLRLRAADPGLRSNLPNRGPTPKVDDAGNAHFSLSELIETYKEATSRDLLGRDDHFDMLSFFMAMVTPPGGRPLKACEALYQELAEVFKPLTAEEVTVMVQAYARARAPTRAVEVFEEFRRSGGQPVQNLYGALIRAAAVAEDKALAKKYFDEMLSSGLCGKGVAFDPVYTALQRL